ncbi:MAG TPA: HAD-IC family P-type ATPase [Kofleriaceae bacterium]|jgi:Cu2+-exporting ATPase|nr:HAD-IC family P-type ATPase [Kofleriaceae bacterium]
MFLLKLLVLGAAAVTGREYWSFFRAELRGDPRTAEPEPAPTPTPQPQPQPTDLEDEKSASDDTLALTAGAAAMFGAGALIHPGFRVFGFPLLFAGMLPAAVQAWRGLRSEGRLRYVGLEVIQSVAEIVAGFSGLTILGWTIFTGGQRLMLATRRGTRQELLGAFAQAADHVWLIRDGVEVQIPLGQVRRGDLLAIRAGDTVPVDGCIAEGAIGVDQRALTGESRMQELGVGDPVLAVSVVLSGEAILRAERTGDETLAARVEVLLTNTESYEQALIDRISRSTERSVRPTLAIAGYGLLTRGPIGILGGLWTNALDMAWLTAPFSMLNTMRAASQLGILVKDGRSLEQLTTIDTVVFDKTGTLTLNKYEVCAVHTRPGLDRDEVLGIAAGVEGRMQHPIASAIVEAARDSSRAIPPIDEIMHELGYGLRGILGGEPVLLGSRRLMDRHSIELPEPLADAEQHGHSLVYLALGGRYAGAIELTPRLRPEAEAVVARLRERGLEVMVLTGDDEAPTRALAAKLGITRYFARVLPEGKADVLATLQAEGRRVCFVGDGINDALAMHRANVSVSVGDASTLALESSQIVLRSNSLESLEILLQIGERFAWDQRVVLGSSLLTTAINTIGFMFARASLGSLISVYLLGFGASLVTASLPRVRRYEQPASRTLGPSGTSVAERAGAAEPSAMLDE